MTGETATTMNLFHQDLQSADVTGPSPSNVTESVNAKTKSSFLQKLLSRQLSNPKLVTAGIQGQAMQSSFNLANESSQIDLHLMQCPYIRPLGKQLKPRVESLPMAARRTIADSVTPKSRQHEEASRAAGSGAVNTDEEPYGGPAACAMSLQNLVLRKKIAAAATANVSHLKEWDRYVKCYSEGHYSLTVPPGPPPKNSGFTYLPSTYPRNETERLANFLSSPIWCGTDIVWSSLEVERARSLIMAATTKFATPSAAVSFFNHDTEIVQAERGYSRHLIPRRYSIASHVLLADEVMTILDTHMDWRFAGNPLVVKDPKIRFFAGAPLLSSNSQVMGVFAIFSSEPRVSFTAKEKRDLIAMSEIATRELMLRKVITPSMILHSCPALRPDSHIFDTVDPHGRISNPLISPDKKTHAISSKAFRYHNKSQDGISRSRIIIGSHIQDAHAQNEEHTPPNSDVSDAAPSPLLEMKRYGRNYKQLTLARSPCHPQKYIRTPESQNFGNMPSNIVSLQATPSWGRDLDLFASEPHPCRANFFRMGSSTNSSAESRRVSLSLDDAVVPLTEDSDGVSDRHSNADSLSTGSEDGQTLLEEALLFSDRLDATSVEKTESAAMSIPQRDEHSTRRGNHGKVDNLVSPAMDGIFANYSLNQKVLGFAEVQAETKFAAELWAKNLEFDAIYAVELLSKKILFENPELKSADNVETRVLVSYGLPDPINFDIQIHMNVLRGSGAAAWENKNALPNDYSQGFMMPLRFESDMLDRRSCGVVFGAFRKRPDDVKGSQNLRSGEIGRLQRAADVLKDMLIKSPWTRQSNRDELWHPPIPGSQPYPAREAVEC